jgi:hypothetical protein
MADARATTRRQFLPLQYIHAHAADVPTLVQ